MNQRESQIQNDIISKLIKSLDPQKILLFGSRSKSNGSSSSDFDFAIQCIKVQDSEKLRLREEIEAIAGFYKIDVVYLDEVDEEFKDIIYETGKVVYEKGNGIFS